MEENIINNNNNNNNKDISLAKSSKKAKIKTSFPPKVCFEFTNKGYCKRGDVCAFDHITSNEGDNEIILKKISPKFTKLMKKKKLENDEARRIEEESINEGIKLSLVDLEDESIYNNDIKDINNNNIVEKKSKNVKKLLDLNNNKELSKNKKDTNKIHDSLSDKATIDNENIIKGHNVMIPGMLLIPSNVTTASLSSSAKSFILPKTANSFTPNVAAKTFVPSNNNNNNKLVKENKFESCIICSNDMIQYMSIGQCNHPICSICSLRLRYKTKSNDCAVCKQNLDYVIVYSSSLGSPTYESFGISGDTPIPGVNIDPATRMLYVDCPKHFKEMEIKRSFTCPIKKCNSNLLARFTTQNALTKHLSKEHQLFICHLCLDNRPLFISEHKLMNDIQLKKHMKEKAGSLTGAGGDKTAGHPLCKFCNCHFHDSLALYNHMTKEHHTCHLCPIKYQHRFYDGINDISKHWRENHIICEICHPRGEKINIRDGQISIFGDDNDYCDHMYGVHGVIKNKSNSINLGFQIGYSSNSTESTFVDLYMSQADPYQSVNEEENERRMTNSSNTVSNNSTLTNIPNNMRIAGRVTGAGNFIRNSQDDLIQASIDEAYPKMNKSLNKSSKPLNQRNNNNDFPEMIPAISKASKIESSIQPHPLSVVHSKLKELEISKRIQLEEKEKLRIEEEKKRQRNDLLANALGIKPTIKYSGDDSDTLLLCSLCDNNYSIIDINTASIYINDIKRPLYPSSLANWSSKNKLELQKIEKKIYDFLEQKSNKSVNFKPMDSTSRNMLHTLSKFYHLNSYEYDDESKKRYVSLVKRNQSASPKFRLSGCMILGLSVPPSVETINGNPLPIIYFIAKNTVELIATTSITTRDNSTSLTDLPSVYSLIIKCQNMLETSGINHRDVFKITTIKQCGVSGIGFEFKSLLEASKFYNLLINSSSSYIIISSQYYLEPAFDYNLYIQDLKIEINEEENINKKEENIRVIPPIDGSFSSLSTSSFGFNNGNISSERRPIIILPRSLPLPELALNESWEDVDIDSIGKETPIEVSKPKVSKPIVSKPIVFKNLEKNMNYSDAFKETTLVEPTHIVVKPKKIKKNIEDSLIHSSNQNSFASFNNYNSKSLSNYILNSSDDDNDSDRETKEIDVDNDQGSKESSMGSINKLKSKEEKFKSNWIGDVSDSNEENNKIIELMIPNKERKLEVIPNKKIEIIWTCNICTLDNEIFNDICSCCESKRF